MQSESKLIHFFESRFLDESKLIHSGAYTNLYAYPLWLLPLWAGTCFASIACGHPHAHFWGVPQTPWGRSASIKKASRRIKRLAFYFEKCKFFTLVSRAQPPTAYSMTRLFLRSTLETDCWCGEMNCWTGWSSKRSIKPKTRTRRLSGLMNSFVVVPVVVFVSRKETMQRERYIQSIPAPRT